MACHWTAIIWNNDDLVYWCTYLSLDLKELKETGLCERDWEAPIILWHHNEHDGISNDRHLGCLLRLFKRTSKKTSKLCVTGLCERNSPGTGEFPSQRASSAKNVSIWWRHHESMQQTWKQTVATSHAPHLMIFSDKFRYSQPNWVFRSLCFTNLCFQCECYFNLMLYTALCLFVKCDTCNSYGNKIDLIWFDLIWFIYFGVDILGKHN